MTTNDKQKLNLLLRSCVFTFIIFIINVIGAASAFAQFSGGAHDGREEATIGGDIYTGGSQSGSTSATSGVTGSLSHGDATHLSFVTSPSSSKAIVTFSRQPVVAVLDANNNIVSSDNSTQVTVAIMSNPGNGGLRGTTAVRVVNGVATFTDLQINKGGELYNLRADAAGLTGAISATFDIFPGTGPKLAAVWDEDANSGAGGHVGEY